MTASCSSTTRYNHVAFGAKATNTVAAASDAIAEITLPSIIAAKR